MRRGDRIVIVDRHADFAELLTAALRRAGRTAVTTFTRAEAALDTAVLSAVDMVLLDPVGQAPGVIRALSRSFPALRVVAVSNDTGYGTVIEALRDGARGFIGKQRGAAEIAQLVSHTDRKVAVLCPLASEHVMQAVRLTPVPSPPSNRLTAREADVVRLLALGHGYNAIAMELGIGRGTVQSHVKNLYRKLDVRTKSEAVAVAIRLGVLDQVVPS